MTLITQEMIAAFVDGELHEEDAGQVRQAAQRDASIRDKINRYRALRAEVALSYRSVLSEPVPTRLESLLTRPTVSGRRQALTQRFNFFRLSSWAMPAAIAASLMVGVFAGGVMDRSNPDDMRFAVVGDYANDALHTLLLRQPSGVEHDGATVLATYKSASGEICRAFILEKTERLQGLACRRADGAWSVVALSPSAPAGSYTLASERAEHMFERQLEQFVELSDAEEEQFLKNAWER